MRKQRVLLTGATGAMGLCGLRALLQDAGEVQLVALARPSEKNKALLRGFAGHPSLEIVWGDLTDYGDVRGSVRGCDVVLHVGAFVSPEADYHPRRAMQVNYGSAVHLVRAIRELKQEQKTKLVSIGTVAQTGDRMPPIHWGRVGDPLKPSVYDYYAVSKIAAERHIIESGLPFWVSLRQTGILGAAMARIEDPIMFHNCLDNVLEYVSDRDSGALLRNLCQKERAGCLGSEFWGHVFNIGGGAGCRASTTQMYRRAFGAVGIQNLADVMDSRWFATRNFHGHFYLDSGKLNDILHFCSDSMEYFYDTFLKEMGGAATAAKCLAALPGGRRLLARVMKKRFEKLAGAAHGTVRFIKEDSPGQVAAYWGAKAAWEAIPPLEQFPHFSNWDAVVHIDHGYDESQPEEKLGLADVQGAARFRGGACTDAAMPQGDWSGKLHFRCAFGHAFAASPRLVLEGGHWCPVCERESWNYYERARRDAFFAQVWYPLHPQNEPPWAYPKEVSELDVNA